jgi:hypothetical protein
MTLINQGQSLAALNLGSDELLAGGIFLFAAVIILAMLAIKIAVCFFLSSCFRRVPPPHRQQEPGMVWLLLIPCFSIVWNFFVYPKLADSFASYFRAQGRTDVGDCGRGIGTAFCICAVCSVVPYLGMLAALASLILWIIFLVKAAELKRQIPESWARPSA